MQDFSRDQQTGNGEVRIGEHWYPVPKGAVNELNLAMFQGRVLFGEYNKDSDPLISSWVLSTFAGGMGNEILREGVDDDTYWTATGIETRFPEGATLARLTEAFGSTNDDAASCYPVGDFPASAPMFYAAFGDELHRWDKDAKAFTYIDDLAAPPVRTGVEYEESFYIPLGAEGIAIVAGDESITTDTDYEVIDLILWDKKLVGLTSDGGLLIRNPGAGSFAAPTAEMTVPSGLRARRLVRWINNSGDPAVYIVTDSVVYAFDPDGEELYETRLNYPKHPYQGLGAANWRGDAMFVSVGTGIHRYNGSLITAMGPDGRYGLPAHLRGYIVDLEPEYNGLLALVRGLPNPDQVQPDPGNRSVPPMYRNRHTYAIQDMPVAPVFSSLMRWADDNWHPVWSSPEPTGFPTFMYVSQADGEYRLWWGYGDKMHTQELSIPFENPKQSLLAGGYPMETTGELITGWFDADMEGFTKLASHVEVNLEDVDGKGGVGGSVQFEYQIRGGAWKMLGIADTLGLTILPFQNVHQQVGVPFSRGLPHREIRFRITYTQAQIEDPDNPGQFIYNQNTSPLMSAIFKFIKVPESQMTWSFPVDLSKDYKDIGRRDLFAYLQERAYSQEFTQFAVGDTMFRARIVQVSNERGTGYDTATMPRVNIAEIRLGPTNDPNRVVKYYDMVNSVG